MDSERDRVREKRAFRVSPFDVGGRSVPVITSPIVNSDVVDEAKPKSLNLIKQKYRLLQKKWGDEDTGYYSFMLYPRSLSIAWGHDDTYWKWNCIDETSEETIEIAKLRSVSWLDVGGKFKISELSAGALYEIAYVVKLENRAYGWEKAITLRLTHPDGADVKIQESKICLMEMPKEEWIELHVGNFVANDGETKEVCFDLYEHGRSKSGLLIKCAIIRPKSSLSTDQTEELHQS